MEKLNLFLKSLCAKCEYYNDGCNAWGTKTEFMNKLRKSKCVKFKLISQMNLKNKITLLRKKLLTFFWNDVWEIPTQKTLSRCKNELEKYLYYMKLYLKEFIPKKGGS